MNYGYNCNNPLGPVQEKGVNTYKLIIQRSKSSTPFKDKIADNKDTLFIKLITGNRPITASTEWNNHSQFLENEKDGNKNDIPDFAGVYGDAWYAFHADKETKENIIRKYLYSIVNCRNNKTPKNIRGNKNGAHNIGYPSNHEETLKGSHYHGYKDGFVAAAILGLQIVKLEVKSEYYQSARLESGKIKLTKRECIAKDQKAPSIESTIFTCKKESIYYSFNYNNLRIPTITHAFFPFKQFGFERYVEASGIVTCTYDTDDTIWPSLLIPIAQHLSTQDNNEVALQALNKLQQAAAEFAGYKDLTSIATIDKPLSSLNIKQNVKENNCKPVPYKNEGTNSIKKTVPSPVPKEPLLNTDETLSPLYQYQEEHTYESDSQSSKRYGGKSISSGYSPQYSEYSVPSPTSSSTPLSHLPSPTGSLSPYTKYFDGDKRNITPGNNLEDYLKEVDEVNKSIRSSPINGSNNKRKSNTSRLSEPTEHHTANYTYTQEEEVGPSKRNKFSLESEEDEGNTVYTFRSQEIPIGNNEQTELLLRAAHATKQAAAFFDGYKDNLIRNNL